MLPKHVGCAPVSMAYLQAPAAAPAPAAAHPPAARTSAEGDLVLPGMSDAEYAGSGSPVWLNLARARRSAAATQVRALHTGLACSPAHLQGFPHAALRCSAAGCAFVHLAERSPGAMCGAALVVKHAT